MEEFELKDLQKRLKSRLESFRAETMKLKHIHLKSQRRSVFDLRDVIKDINSWFDGLKKESSCVLVSFFFLFFSFLSFVLDFFGITFQEK